MTSSYRALDHGPRPGKSGAARCLRLAAACVSLITLACQTRSKIPGDTRTCEQRRAELLAVLGELPEQSLAMPIRTRLPSSTLSGAFHRGSILELNDPSLTLDGRALTGTTRQASFDNLRAALSELRAASPGAKPRLNLAVAPSTDIHTLQAYLEHIPAGIDLEVLFTTDAGAVADGSPPTGSVEAASPEGRLLTTTDPAARAAAARQGYDQYADCETVARAAAEVEALDATRRWPELKAKMLQAIPACSCETIDADGLRNLLVAEQRAGNVALGSVPADFLRDVRCSASMPLRSIQQVLDDIDKFDAEFAGDWREDALQFEQVVTNERLLNYLCTAMPGETLEALQHDGRTFYFRTPGNSTCQAWRFQPLSPGSPMGSWRRNASASENGPELTFDYRVGGNEIRIYGPTGVDAPPPEPAAVEDGVAPPEAETYPCDQNIHMIGVDATSLQLKSGGRWFFDAAACQAASPADAFQGCVAGLAGR
jgi:hypothetical protein